MSWKLWAVLGVFVVVIVVVAQAFGGGPDMPSLTLLGILFGGTTALIGGGYLLIRMGKVGWVVFGLGLFGSFSKIGNLAEWGSFVVFYLILALILGYGWKGLAWLGRKFNEWQGPPPAPASGWVKGEEDEAAERPAMQTLTPILRAPYQEDRYDEDERRIVRVCAAAGYDVSQDDAFRIWGDRSESWSASWLRLPDEDGELLEWVLKFGVV